MKKTLRPRTLTVTAGSETIDLPDATFRALITAVADLNQRHSGIHVLLGDPFAIRTILTDPRCADARKSAYPNGFQRGDSLLLACTWFPAGSADFLLPPPREYKHAAQIARLADLARNAAANMRDHGKASHIRFGWDLLRSPTGAQIWKLETPVGGVTLMNMVDSGGWSAISMHSTASDFLQGGWRMPLARFPTLRAAMTACDDALFDEVEGAVR